MISDWIWWCKVIGCCGGMLQDAGSQGIGFLLGSLGVSVAMTSEACYKGLPRTQSGDVITFKGSFPWFFI